jgi:alpha-galactosidase
MFHLTRRSFLKSSLLLLGDVRAELVWSEPAPSELSLQRLLEWDVRLNFHLDPPVLGWTAVDNNPLSYRSNDKEYSLLIKIHRIQPGTFAVQFSLSAQRTTEFRVIRYSVKAKTPFTGIYRVWHYHGGPLDLMGQFRSYTRGLATDKEFTQLYAANTGIPFALCSDREGQNRFSLGMLDQVETTGLRIEGYSVGPSMRAEGLNYSFEFAKPIGYSLSRRSLDDSFYLDTRPQDWFETVQGYAAWVEEDENITPLVPPPTAFDPIWCTWYPFGQNIDERTIIENAQLCRQVGINTLLIDAGYNNALRGGMDTPENIRIFNAHTGDWIANSEKFPNFRAMVDQLHSLGQRVTAWVALFLLGTSTQAYAKARHLLKSDEDGQETLYLCPQHSETASYLSETFLKMARDYDLDGYWLDFMDSMHLPCYGKHAHDVESPGAAYNRCLARVRDSLLGFKPDFLIETRMPMANLNVKSFANVLETTDMPFDFDINRSLGVFLRAFGEGPALKLDPAQWHIQERPENVAKLCSTVVLGGTPVFSLDFRLLPPTHLEVVKAWLDFYREHRVALVHAKLTPLSFEPYFPAVQLEAGSTLFLYLGSATVVPAQVRRCTELFLINASDRDYLNVQLEGIGIGSWALTSHDCFLKEVQKEELSVDNDHIFLNRPVQQGGMLRLSKV